MHRDRLPAGYGSKTKSNPYSYYPLVGLGGRKAKGKGKGAKGKRKAEVSDLEKMVANGAVDATLQSDGADVVRSRRVGLRQKPQPTDN
jgi:hypothetical protein